jgi:putative ABC transport system substrate-binding protein
VAVCGSFRRSDDATNGDSFLKALESLGWAEGRSVHLETRWTEGDPQRLRKDAAELAALSPDVILATTTPAAMLIKRATNSVPIVFVGTTDPVGAGLVASLSRPHGNATGFMAFEYTLAAKWLELLKEIVPRVTRAAVLRDLRLRPGSVCLRQFRLLAQLVWN